MTRSLVGATLLVGIDFSLCCERALRRAVAIAEQNRAQLSLVHVFEWPVGVDVGSGGGSGLSDRAASPVSNMLLTQARTYRQQLGHLCSNLVADRAPAEIHVLIGDPAEALLHAAGQSDAQLIVLGALGRRMLPRATVGSTTARVCAGGALPVLLVSAGERAQGREGSFLFVSARKELIWTCARCGLVQQPGDTCQGCRLCIELPEARADARGPRQDQSINLHQATLATG